VKKMNLTDRKELIDIKGDRISWKELLNKNKIIYVDFWASWCVPCRKKMPASMKLKKQLKGKNMSFIYLSIDKNAMNWKSALEEERLDQQNSFLILNNTESNIGKRFKIKLIPHYMLVGRDGKIISDDAPAPSDKTILNLIDKNL